MRSRSSGVSTDTPSGYAAAPSRAGDTQLPPGLIDDAEDLDARVERMLGRLQASVRDVLCRGDGLVAEAVTPAVGGLVRPGGGPAVDAADLESARGHERLHIEPQAVRPGDHRRDRQVDVHARERAGRNALAPAEHHARIRVDAG